MVPVYEMPFNLMASGALTLSGAHNFHMPVLTGAFPGVYGNCG